MRASFGALLVAALMVTSGCRDLSNPGDKPLLGPDGQPLADNLVLLEPNDSARAKPLPRSVFFRIRASAKNGVQRVVLRCAESFTLASWDNGAPDRVNESVLVEDRVEFDRCVAGDGELTGEQEILLTIGVEDLTGLEVKRLAVPVKVDFSAPVSPSLTADLPSTLFSGQRLRGFEIRSSAPLRALPQVFVDGRVVAVTAVTLEDGGVSHYAVAESQPLLLGAARIDGGTTNTAILEETERLVTVQIRGQGLLGHETRLDYLLALRRTSWERNVPGTLVAPSFAQSGVESPPPTTSPVASEHGVTVAIIKSLNASPTDWVPAYFDEDDGAFHPSPADVLDGGFYPVTLDAEGGAIMSRSIAEFAYLPFAATSIGQTVTLNQTRSSPVTAYGAGSCWHSVESFNFTSCGTTDHTLFCLGAGHSPKTPYSLTDFDSTDTVSSFQFSAGPNFYSLFAPSITDGTRLRCAPTMSSFRFDGTTLERMDLVREFEEVQRIFTLERGDFAVVLQDGDFATTAYRYGLNGPTREGEIIGLPYFSLDAWTPSSGSSGEIPVAYRPNGTLLLYPLTVTAGVTEIRGLGPDRASAGTALFDGYYDLTENTVRSLYSHNVVTLADDPNDPVKSTTYFLVHRNGRTSGYYSVLAVDQDTRPLWVYHYPRKIQGAAQGFGEYATLVGSSKGRQLYLVDYENNAITAIAR